MKKDQEERDYVFVEQIVHHVATELKVLFGFVLLDCLICFVCLDYFPLCIFCCLFLRSLAEP